MNIEIFQPYHAGGVSDLIVPIQQAEFGIPITYDEQPDLRDIPGFYQRGAGQFWVAVDGGCVVGSIGLLDIGDGEGALRKMFVASAYRGSRHGTAGALLGTLLHHARESGLQVIYLGTTDKFRAAHRFYEKSGFEIIAPSKLPATFPRMKVDTRFYRLELGS
jgi:N-acetylglutamate synthase-like GNAT family acetyltransferase